MRRIFLTLLIVLAVAALAVGPALAQGAPPPPSSSGYVRYVVQPGDTLASIARRFCTTTSTIYSLNAQTIGPNPNAIWPGMVLWVPNQCGGAPPPPGGVYDHGPRAPRDGQRPGQHVLRCSGRHDVLGVRALWLDGAAARRRQWYPQSLVDLSGPETHHPWPGRAAVTAAAAAAATTQPATLYPHLSIAAVPATLHAPTTVPATLHGPAALPVTLPAAAPALPIALAGAEADHHHHQPGRGRDPVRYL